MITLTNVSMSYGSQLLFADVTLLLTPGNRYGLVGANGTGKTTFLQLLAGQQTPLDGQIAVNKHSRLGFLKQDQFKYEDELILNVVLQGKPELWKAIQERDQLLYEKASDEKSGYRLAELEEIIAHYDGYTAESFAQELLIGLGVKEKYHFEPLRTLSGGYKLRVLLAQVLFNDPDILLLDEPTNHLDIVTIYWLEQYLKRRFEGVLVVISHDRSFLNNLVTHILDIDYGEITNYPGNYNQFMVRKQQIVDQKLHEKKDIEKKVSQLRLFVQRFGAKASKARQAQSREKQIERMEMAIPDIQHSSRRAPHLSFTIRRPSGKTVLTVKNVSKSFNGVPVLKGVTFSVQRGEKILIIGQNGIGKSTLLKIIAGVLTPDRGTIEWGYETSVSYFAQDHHELLNKSESVYNWLLNHAPDNVLTSTIRSTLGAVLFSRDEVDKDILSLSGGEAARLLLARLLLEHGNVLLFDEPTNHLDIEGREALAKAIEVYEGTVLLVSHDRHFATHIATRVLAFTHEGVKDFQGTYNEYLAYYGEDYLNRQWLTTSR
jgi:ATPase subunit of ABC transporter with duplicated ATPase domains